MRTENNPETCSELWTDVPAKIARIIKEGRLMRGEELLRSAGPASPVWPAPWSAACLCDRHPGPDCPDKALLAC
jgi:hypothetical protein